MTEIRLFLLGFGSANQSLVEMMMGKSEMYYNRRCLQILNGTSGVNLIPWRIVSIVTGQHGRVFIPNIEKDGLCYEIDPECSLKRIKSDGMLDDSLVVSLNGADHYISNREIATDGHHQDIDASIQSTIKLIQKLAKAKTANILVEAIPSNPRHGGGEPALSFIRTSLEAGLHVVSANKGPLAQKQYFSNDIEEAYWYLQKTAKENKVQYLHESAVMDGVPIFSLWKRSLPNANLTKLRGCLNSTTTMILTRMEGPNGETFDEALSKAKELGIVEADESLDIDGYDAAVKLRALLVVFSNQSDKGKILIPPIDDIPRDTIRNITRDRIKCAYNKDESKYRLVASAELVDASNTENNAKVWNAQVQLELVKPSDPIYNLKGTSSSIQLYTDVLGPITMVSTDPTLVDTAYGLFSDIVRVASSI